MVESTATPYTAMKEDVLEMNNLKPDLETQAGFAFDWSEDEEARGEKSALLAEFRRQNQPSIRRPPVETRD